MACGTDREPPVDVDASGYGTTAQDSSTRDDGSVGNDGSAAAECASTWEAIQVGVFEGHGCTSGPCHDTVDPAGGLDLSAGHAYENLVFRAPRASVGEGLYLVQPGEQELSLLYLKLAAATSGTPLPSGAGAPMPSGDAPALSDEELAAMRLWIRAGAPQTGVVAGTSDLLSCSQPALATPNKSPRPPAPAATDGFQHFSGPWSVAPNSEDEVCFHTYYDLSDVAPDWARVPCSIGGSERECVAVRRAQLSQDAQSHHSIINVYGGSGTPDEFGTWRCAGGALEGTACDPVRFGVPAAQGGAECGEGGACQTIPMSRVGCGALGPSDVDTASVGVGGAQSPVATSTYPEGVYATVPLRGVVAWNSHGFNLTTQTTTIDQYNTFWYAQPAERQYHVQGIGDGRYIFAMNVPPYQQQEICASYTLPQHARLISLSSHVHKRGILWRTWLPPNQPDCTPESTDAACGPSSSAADYLSEIYNDPITRVFDEPLVFDDADPVTRTLKYCAVYDNGDEIPGLLKRISQLPEGSQACTRPHRACAGGPNPGMVCAGDDSLCGEGGVCDACPVRGGVTTEDEMFILVGSYYIVPPGDQ